MAIDRSVPRVHLHVGDERRTTGTGGVHEHVYPLGLLEFVRTKAVAVA